MVTLHVPNGVKGRAGHADASLTATLTDCFEVPAADASARATRSRNYEYRDRPVLSAAVQRLPLAALHAENGVALM
jgi:hypothetical protein